MNTLETQLARIETKLDTALAAICDHEQRLRGLERGNPHNSKFKSEVIRLLVGALLALAGVGAGRWVWR
ncbi:MAG: hypothetical protein DDT20_01742 [Firmicutes bacterium]|nr:hypothetical protein [Bacillota bacterium]